MQQSLPYIIDIILYAYDIILYAYVRIIYATMDVATVWTIYCAFAECILISAHHTTPVLQHTWP